SSASGCVMASSGPSASTLSSASVTTVAISRMVSLSVSRPVISRSIHTSRASLPTLAPSRPVGTTWYRGSGGRQAPLGTEVVAQAGAGLVAQHAAGDFDAVVVARVGQQVEDAAGGAGLGIGGAVDHAGDAGVHHRHRAHRAGLQGHVQ